MDQRSCSGMRPLRIEWVRRKLELHQAVERHWLNPPPKSGHWNSAQSGNYWSPSERRSRSQHYFGRSAMGQTFDIAQLTTKPTRQPKMTSATLCRPCSTPVSLEWDVSPAAITMAAVIGA